MLPMLNQEKNALIKKKALYALSALVRGNLHAQNELVKLNGIQSIINVIKDKSLPTAIHIKAIDLLFGLIEEQTEMMNRQKESREVDVHERLVFFFLLPFIQNHVNFFLSVICIVMWKGSSV